MEGSARPGSVSPPDDRADTWRRKWPSRQDRRKKSREKDVEVEVEMERPTERNRDREPIAGGSRRARENRRARDSDEDPRPLDVRKPKLKDVTNSPPPRPSLATLEIPPGRLHCICKYVFLLDDTITRSPMHT